MNNEQRREAHIRFNESFLALAAYCEVFGLSLFTIGEGPMSDRGEWDGTMFAGFDPKYIDEMTPVCPISLSDEGKFFVVSEHSDLVGDVLTECTLEQVVGAVRSGERLHATEDDDCE